MAKKHRIPEDEAKKVEKIFRKEDDHSEAQQVLKSSISTEAGHSMRCRYYDGVERPATGSSTIEAMENRGSGLWMVHLKSWPTDVQNPVAIFNDEEKAERIVSDVAQEWGFLVQ